MTNQYMVKFIGNMDQMVYKFWKRMDEMAPTRLVGGSVRDVLLGKNPKDMDFATVATVEQIKAIAVAHGYEILSYGEDHGTIAVKVGEHVIEVTTLRVDEVTDGRHAQVRFVNDFEVDAERRDLTINAMYADISGTVFDFFGGQQDLSNSNGVTVRFVGAANKRIQEDYLRILRYFRFVARYNGSMDPFDLVAIQENSTGLNKVSVERCWSELKGIASAKYAVVTLKVMDEIGITGQFGLSCNKADMNFARKCEPNGMSVIAAMLGFSPDNVKNFAEKMKLSKAEVNELLFWCDVKSAAESDAPYVSVIEYMRDKNCRVIDIVSMDTIRSGVVAIDRYRYADSQCSPAVKAWDLIKDLIDNPPRPTVTAAQLMEGGLVGKELGQVLKELGKEAWDKRVAKVTLI